VHRLEDELRRRLPEIFDFLDLYAFDGLWFWDIGTGEEWYSPRFCHLLGYDQSDVPTSSDWWQRQMHPDDLKKTLLMAERHLKNRLYPYDDVVRYRHKDGSIVWVRCRGTVLDNGGKPTRMIGTHVDVTALIEAQHRLEVETLRDPLTDLLNRRGLDDALHRAIETVRRLNCEAFAIFLDVDDFKAVNDRLGHTAGDRILRHVAKTIVASCRVLDDVGRHGGDEFIVLILVRDKSEATQAAERIRVAVETQPAQWEGAPVPLTCSSALVPVCSPDGIMVDRIDVLVKLAGPYLSRSKANGKNQVVPASIAPPAPTRVR